MILPIIFSVFLLFLMFFYASIIRSITFHFYVLERARTELIDIKASYAKFSIVKFWNYSFEDMIVLQ